MNIFNKNKKRKKGFTLIELIIVIAILAILAAIAVPQFSKIRQNANISTDIANAKTIHSSVATEIASNKILLPATSSIYALTQVGESGGQVDITADIDGNAKPKAIQKGEFKVELDKDGNIKVNVVKDGASELVYPNPATNSIYGK